MGVWARGSINFEARIRWWWDWWWMNPGTASGMRLRRTKGSRTDDYFVGLLRGDGNEGFVFVLSGEISSLL